jgi:hypothetical protein
MSELHHVFLNVIVIIILVKRAIYFFPRQWANGKGPACYDEPLREGEGKIWPLICCFWADQGDVWMEKQIRGAGIALGGKASPRQSASGQTLILCCEHACGLRPQGLS